MSDFFQGLGALLGAAAFFWHLYDSFQRLLHIELTVTHAAGFVIAHTVVENKGSQGKSISNALVLVGPESESPLETASALLGKSISFTNELENVHVDSPIVGVAGRALIPVDFYFSENVNIADERLGYDVPIEVTNVPKSMPYAVRFFIFATTHLHRSTEATFVVPP